MATNMLATEGLLANMPDGLPGVMVPAYMESRHRLTVSPVPITLYNISSFHLLLRVGLMSF